MLTVGVSFHFLVSLWLSQFSPGPSYTVPFPKSHMYKALHSLTDVQPDHEFFCLSSLLSIHFQAQTVLHLQQSLHSIHSAASLIVFLMAFILSLSAWNFMSHALRQESHECLISLNFSLRLFAHLTSILITTWIPLYTDCPLASHKESH